MFCFYFNTFTTLLPLAPLTRSSAVNSASAEIKIIERSLVIRPARDGTHEHELIEHDLTVIEVAFGETVGTPNRAITFAGVTKPISPTLKWNLANQDGRSKWRSNWRINNRCRRGGTLRLRDFDAVASQPSAQRESHPYAYQTLIFFTKVRATIFPA